MRGRSHGCLLGAFTDTSVADVLLPERTHETPLAAYIEHVYMDIQRAATLSDRIRSKYPSKPIQDMDYCSKNVFFKTC